MCEWLPSTKIDWKFACKHFLTEIAFILPFIFGQTNLSFKALSCKIGCEDIISKDREKYNWTRELFFVSGIPYCSQHASKHSVANLQQELHHFGMSNRSVENRSLFHTFNCDVSTSLKQQLNGFYSSISGSFEQGSTACLVRRVHRSTLCNKLHMYSCICDYFETNVVYLWLTGRQTNTKNTRNLVP